jgi:DHA2 family multidrug resistance protein
MMNLMRQLGGSFGIAVLGTYLTHMSGIHRAALVSHIYAGNPAFDQRLQGLTAAFTTKGFDPVHARQAALAMIDRVVQGQAMTMSYNDAFQLIGLTVVLVAPAVFLLRGSRARSAPVPVPVDAH